MGINEPQHSAAEIKKLKRITVLVYILQAITIPLVVTYFIAPLLVYWQRKKARGTWLESHLRWQINTFWFGLTGFAAGILALTGGNDSIRQIGATILAITLTWLAYRIGQGSTRLGRGQEMIAEAGKR